MKRELFKREGRKERERKGDYCRMEIKGKIRKERGRAGAGRRDRER